MKLYETGLFCLVVEWLGKCLSTKGLFLLSVPDFPVPAPGLPWLREGQQELAARPRPGDIVCSTCSVLSLPCSGQTDGKARCGPAAPCCGWSQCGRQEGGAGCQGRTCGGGVGAWARPGTGKKVNQVCRRPGPNSLSRTERAALAPISNTPVRRASISPPSTPPMALAKRRTMSVGSPDPRFVCKVCLDHEVSASLLDCCRLYASS